jgi:predicted metal-dependent enzyme (double-stranded beta helix superfamily)
MSLAETLQELRHGAHLMRIRDLERLIDGLRPEPDELQAHLRFASHHYTRNVIQRTANFEALLLCWRGGQRSRIHDHGKSICGMVMLEGVLSAENYRRTPAGLIHRDFSEDFTPGSILSIQTTEIHRVSNLRDEDGISLHFYLPPLQNNAMWDMPGAREGLPDAA